MDQSLKFLQKHGHSQIKICVSGAAETGHCGLGALEKAKEEKILDAHLHNLEEFVRNIDQDKGRDDTKNKLHEKRLIFWGYSTYSKVVSELLDAV